MTDPFACSTSCLVVVKIGSALLIDGPGGAVRQHWLDGMCADFAELVREGHRLVIVSSGAIALGRSALALRPGALRLEESQAAAAVGQVKLAQAWAEALARQQLVAAQVLLTLDDTEERRRYLNARATLATLLELNAVAVINENDTVATAEIRYGDNDRLAARVASMIGADWLILFSDVDGLYTANPHREPDARYIDVVEQITPRIEAMAAGSVSGLGRGGMASKIAAARIATNAGCQVVIARGQDHALQALRRGGRHTRFLAATTPSAARKRWIAGTLKPQGTLHIDAGALAALRAGKSLLPAGVCAVEGDFSRGDAVCILGPDGREAGRGLSAYSAQDARALLGRHTDEIPAILGYRGRDAMVHRDDLALTATVPT
ncbi:MAG: glutamate 5-kinase [Alphaproteobacteria bacterium]|nr:glutamate 5-kinase [Alphaproteobacteria bacterium]